MPTDIDWAALREKLPMEKTEEQKAKRKEMFKAFDDNGSGYLSLSEVHQGLDRIGLNEFFDCKTVIIRAFTVAKGVNDSAGNNDYVEFCEFRLLLVYLCKYFELWQMFVDIDTSNDRRVDLEEFRAVIPKIQAWGFAVPDPDAEFAAIDTNSSGQILFDEFAEWAIQKGLELEEPHAAATEQKPDDALDKLQPIRVKILTLGDKRVGKSCLVKKFCEPNRFSKEYVPTIGVDYGVKAISKNRDINIDFFDLSGDPDYYEVRNEFYKNVDGVLLVFDVTRKTSFESLGNWLDEAAKFGLSSESATVVIVGNKTDHYLREVTEEEGTSFAIVNNVTYHETSAQNRQGVEDMFDYLLSQLSSIPRLLSTRN